MRLGCISMDLTPTLEQGSLLLLRGIDAIRAAREGWGTLVPRQTAGRYLDHLDGRGLMLLRDFAARARLSSFPLSSVDDTKLVEMVRRGLKTGDLVVLRQDKAGAAAGPNSTAEQRRLVKDIAAQARQPILSIGGRRYRLAADVDLGRIPDRNSYEVVEQQDAAKLLQQVAKQPGTSPELGKLLDRASGLLSRDWRPPAFPEGLVLLRRSPSAPALSKPYEPAITPSQLKKLLVKTEWIEIVLADELGKPYTGPYEIELPDGSRVTGNFDDQGLWGDYDIDPGACKLVLPDVPEQAKPGTAKTWISVKLVDEDGEPMDGYAYTLALPDGSEQKGETDETEIRVEEIDPGTCTLSFEKEA